MKTKLLLLFIAVYSTSINAQNVNIPDANFKAYLVGNPTINTNNDSEIQISEATAFTGSIDVLNQNISDLTGIEAFTASTMLFCHNNQLTNLDISQNTALTTLYCFNNQLTNLDISQNTALTTLYCSNNQLTNLDISQNTALTNLSCTGNQLSSIDISQNTALTHFYCANNQLTNLDLSQNTALILLHAHNNQLTSLDISQNTDLEEAQLHDNQLTSLNLTQNMSLAYLYVKDNQLINLDISQNTNLQELDCLNNQLTNLNVANGNNSNFSWMRAQNNSNLNCIQHDSSFDPTTASTIWLKDSAASWSDNCPTLSVDDYELNDVNIYPNPVNTILQLDLNEIIKKVEVYSVQGQKVLENSTNTIDISNLPSGMYLLKIHTFQEKVGIKRFIKE